GGAGHPRRRLHRALPTRTRRRRRPRRRPPHPLHPPELTLLRPEPALLRPEPALLRPEPSLRHAVRLLRRISHTSRFPPEPLDAPTMACAHNDRRAHQSPRRRRRPVTPAATHRAPRRPGGGPGTDPRGVVVLGARRRRPAGR